MIPRSHRGPHQAPISRHQADRSILEGPLCREVSSLGEHPILPLPKFASPKIQSPSLHVEGLHSTNRTVATESAPSHSAIVVHDISSSCSCLIISYANKGPPPSYSAIIYRTLLNPPTIEDNCSPTPYHKHRSTVHCKQNNFWVGAGLCSQWMRGFALLSVLCLSPLPTDPPTLSFPLRKLLHEHQKSTKTNTPHWSRASPLLLSPFP